MYDLFHIGEHGFQTARFHLTQGLTTMAGIPHSVVQKVLYSGITTQYVHFLTTAISSRGPAAWKIDCLILCQRNAALWPKNE